MKSCGRREGRKEKQRCVCGVRAGGSSQQPERDLKRGSALCPHQWWSLFAWPKQSKTFNPNFCFLVQKWTWPQAEGIFTVLVEEVNLAFAFTNLTYNTSKGTCLFQNMVVWTVCHQHAEASGLVLPASESSSCYCRYLNTCKNKSFLMPFLQSGWSSHLMRWVSWNMGPLFVQRILGVSSSWVIWWRRSQSPTSASWKVIYYLRKTSPL